jgi:hypothetical protein
MQPDTHTHTHTRNPLGNKSVINGRNRLQKKNKNFMKMKEYQCCITTLLPITSKYYFRKPITYICRYTEKTTKGYTLLLFYYTFQRAFTLVTYYDCSPIIIIIIIIKIKNWIELLLLFGLLMSVSFHKNNCSISLYHLFVSNCFLLYFILFSILVLAYN